MAQLKKSTKKSSTKKTQQLKKSPKVNKWLIWLMIVLVAITGAFWVWGSSAATPATATQYTFAGCKYQIQKRKVSSKNVGGIPYATYDFSAKITEFSEACSKLEFRYTHLFMKTLATPTSSSIGNGQTGYVSKWYKQQTPVVRYDTSLWGTKFGLQPKSGNNVGENIQLY